MLLFTILIFFMTTLSGALPPQDASGQPIDLDIPSNDDANGYVYCGSMRRKDGRSFKPISDALCKRLESDIDTYDINGDCYCLTFRRVF